MFTFGRICFISWSLLFYLFSASLSGHQDDDSQFIPVIKSITVNRDSVIKIPYEDKERALFLKKGIVLNNRFNSIVIELDSSALFDYQFLLFDKRCILIQKVKAFLL